MVRVVSVFGFARESRDMGDFTIVRSGFMMANYRILIVRSQVVVLDKVLTVGLGQGEFRFRSIHGLGL